MASVLDLFRLDGRVALVTGAGGGLGLVIARALAEAGATVVLNGRTAARVEPARDGLRADGLLADLAAFDVTDEAAAAGGVAAVVARHRRLDVLVNHAVIVYRRPLVESETAPWRAVVETNLVACYVMARLAARPMLEAGRGRIVNVASVLSRLARPGTSAYVASKHALEGLTKSLAVELGPQGITCNALAPGYFGAGMGEALVERPEFRAMVQRATPLGRWGERHELAGPAVFLASDAAAYMNGHLMLVDGGMAVSQ